MNIDGRIIAPGELKAHLAGLSASQSFSPRFPVLHNTSVPDQATWRQWLAAGTPTMEQWLKNLAGYYAGKGWLSMPHAFVLPDGRIGLGAPFNTRGTHSPSWNSISIGVETVGEFERETWANTPAENAAVALFGELCNHFGWQPDSYARGVRGIHFHKEDPNTDHKTCPGRNVDKARFVSRVLAYMGDSPAAVEVDRAPHLEVPVHVQLAPTKDMSIDAMTSALWLQQRLLAKGYKVPLDGKIGADTELAVLEFQQAHPDLIADGEAGPYTRLALSK